MKNLNFILILLLISSCGQNQKNREDYYTIDDFESVEKVDVHVHISTERDAFVEQARKDNFKLVTVVVDHSAGREEVKEQFELYYAGQ